MVDIVPERRISVAPSDPTATESRSNTFFPQKAAVDLTLGYGADSFLGVMPRKDPWENHSFLTLVDIAVNHHDVFYPLPTRASIHPGNIELRNLPRSVATLYTAGVLRPFQKAVAEDEEGAEQALATHYAQFARFANARSGLLRAWSNFQDQVTPAHVTRMPGVVATWTQTFWDTTQGTEELARRVGIAPENLRRAFDVTFRGQQYDAILGADGVYYFPHRIRELAYGGQITMQRTRFEGSAPWSWGRYLTEAIERSWIPRDAQRVLSIVASLRSRVGMKQATWYGLDAADQREQRDILTSIAAESDLPAQVKDDVRKRIETRLKAAAVPTSIAGLLIDRNAGAVTIALTTGALTVSAWRPRVPGGITRFCRGMLEWPGLFGEDQN
jgi:hypothetical protein